MRKVSFFWIGLTAAMLLVALWFAIRVSRLRCVGCSETEIGYLADIFEAGEQYQSHFNPHQIRRREYHPAKPPARTASAMVGRQRFMNAKLPVQLIWWNEELHRIEFAMPTPAELVGSPHLPYQAYLEAQLAAAYADAYERHSGGDMHEVRAEALRDHIEGLEGVRPSGLRLDPAAVRGVTKALASSRLLLLQLLLLEERHHLVKTPADCTSTWIDMIRALKATDDSIPVPSGLKMDEESYRCFPNADRGLRDKRLSEILAVAEAVY